MMINLHYLFSYLQFIVNLFAPLLVVYIIFLNVQNFQIQHNNANNV